MAKSCHHCGAEWTAKTSPGFREECLNCGEPLHCCRNCRFYDESAFQWCREPAAREQKPRDPDPSNVCEFFQFRDAKPEKFKGKAGKQAQDIFIAPSAGSEAGGGKKDSGPDLEDLLKS
jgi:hypothetical protein